MKNAVRLAMATGAAVGGLGQVHEAMAQTATDEANSELQEVVITGSRIRRVDAETASPVLTVTSAQIEASGLLTAGDILQQLPAISGNATNPSENNGGGDGASNVELRGLDVARTLVLLNGRRIGILGRTTSAVDVNIIPVNSIDHVEVLKEGASAVYGSDAIGGVVNFVTKDATDGVDLGYQFGATTKHDGANTMLMANLGDKGDKGGIEVSLNYNKQDAVSAGNRNYSAHALYLYGGTTGAYAGGSSSTPTGRIYLPAAGTAPGTEETFQTYYGCKPSSGNISVTRISGDLGSSLSDYRCFNSGGPNDDHFNYQPLNLIETPQERGGVFVSGNYKLNDYVEAFTEVLFNHTNSAFQEAPLPYELNNEVVTVPANNYYNPFGIAFGGVGLGNEDNFHRLSALGNRAADYETNSLQTNFGFKGEILNTGWNWEAVGQFGRMDEVNKTSGYLYNPAVASALGPSFLDSNPADATYNKVVCGTPGNIISGCTPVDLFNLTAPGQGAALAALAAYYSQTYTYRSEAGSINTDGNIYTLPAGPIKGAVGYDYEKKDINYVTDFITQGQPPLFNTCLTQQEVCTGNTSGGYSSYQLHAELFFPLLKNLPGVQALNVDIAGRFSDYSLFGKNTTTDFKLEYKPIRDLLVRGTASEVFRAPTLNDLYKAPTTDSPTFTDPCAGLTMAAETANPNLAKACQGVAVGTGFQEPNGQVAALQTGNPNLVPERGSVISGGLVYDASWAPGLSGSVDYWHYVIHNVIETVDANLGSQLCVSTGAPEFCNLNNRNLTGAAAGTVLEIVEPTLNLGQLETDGTDFEVAYKLPRSPYGLYGVTVDASYTNRYEVTSAPGLPAVNYAGQYNSNYGNYARLRIKGGITWNVHGVTGLLALRYISGIVLPTPDAGVPPSVTQVPLDIPAITYADLSIAYEAPWHTKIQAGMINLTNRQPPILYQNNVINANTDVNTYDTLGRRFFVGINQKF